MSPNQTPSTSLQLPPDFQSSSGSGLNPTDFMSVLGNYENTLKYNSGLMKSRQLLVKHMFDSPLTQDEMNQLPADMQNVVKGGDPNAVALQIRVLNDQIQGRANTLDKSVNWLVTGYQNSIQQTQDAINNVKNFVSLYGSKAPEVLKSLYGQNYIDQLKNLGIDVAAMSSAPSVAETRYSYQYGYNVPGTSVPTDPVQAAVQAIVGNEGSDYTTVIPSGQGRALGKYQIMDFNVPQWTQEALGTSLTPDQFLADPNAQDTVANYVIGQYWNQYGNIQDVASMWFTGLPAAKSAGMKDKFGTTSQQYVTSATDRFNQLASPSGTQDPMLQGMLDYYQSTGNVPPFGMGNQALRQRFWTAVGQTGPGMTSAAAAKKATLAAQTSALRTQTTQYEAAQTSLGTLDKQLDLLQQYSDKVDRSGTPVLNKYLLYLKGQIQGDADTQALQNIVQTASYEFAKILSGSAASIAGTTVSSAEDAKALLNANMTPEQIVKIVSLMKAESNFRLTSQKSTINMIQGDITGGDTTGGGTGGSYSTSAVDPLGLGL